MNRFLVWGASLVLLIGVASQSWAQGTIAFDSGFPKSGMKVAQIEVSGTIIVDCGWSLTGSTVTITAWQDGSVESTTTTNITCSNTFGGVITNLNSTQSYNVFVEVILTNGCETVTIRTAVGTATAK